MLAAIVSAIVNMPPLRILFALQCCKIGDDIRPRLWDDAGRMRAARPFVFTDMKRGEGIDEIVRFLKETGGL